MFCKLCDTPVAHVTGSHSKAYSDLLGMVGVLRRHVLAPEQLQGNPAPLPLKKSVFFYVLCLV